MAVQFIRPDLEFILAQIEIAERNAVGAPHHAERRGRQPHHPYGVAT